MAAARCAGRFGHRALAPISLACAGVLASATPARAQDVGYTASVYAARGTYPTDRLTSVYVFNSLDVTGGPLRISASVPFIRQRLTFIDAGTDPALADDTSSGFGDPLIRVDARLVDDRARSLQVGVAGSIKPSIVAADSGLGTGATDVGFGGSVFKGFGGTSLYADVLYWMYGDPEGVEFADSLSYSFGVGRIVGNGRWSGIASLSGFSKGVDGSDAPLQLNVAALALVGRRQSLAITAGVGLNDGSSDFTIGTSWRIALTR